MHCKHHFLEAAFSQLVECKIYYSNSFKFLDMVRCSKVSCNLKIELAVHVEGLMEFVKFCCNMEGDGEFSFLVADHLDKIYEVCPDGHDVPSMQSV